MGLGNVFTLDFPFLMESFRGLLTDDLVSTSALRAMPTDAAKDGKVEFEAG